MAKVRLEGISKTFGRRMVVRDLSLEVADGEFLVLVGPSGCGKTTTLRMIAGLEEPTTGQIWIGERLVNNVPPKDRDIAMVFQSYALYPHMNVYENMAFGLRLRHVPRDEIDRRVRQVADLLGIGDLLERKPRELSGGERQRVALGRAIVREPKVFLMDEPLSNLDAKLRVQMRAELRQLQQRLGATVVYVTHDQTEAMTMGDRIAVMDQGVLQQVGVPLEVYRHPVNLFVAGFIGSPPMNVFRCRVVAANGENWLAAGELRLRTGRWGRALQVGEEVVVGLRPEDIIVVQGDQSVAGALPFTVDVVEPLGSETYIHARSGDVRWVVRTNADTVVRPGQVVGLIPDLRHVCLFEADTGRALARALPGDLQQGGSSDEQ